MHQPISHGILYWGTPVILITTLNPDGTPNIVPVSSARWLGHWAMTGLSSKSKTIHNLPTEDTTSALTALARTTGSNPVPEWKASVGYILVKR
jgi:hypothetical protein